MTGGGRGSDVEEMFNKSVALGIPVTDEIDEIFSFKFRLITKADQ